MITIFEEYHKYIPNQIRYEDLKKGDYVLVTCADLGDDNEVMILVDDPDKTSDGFTIHAQKTSMSDGAISVTSIEGIPHKDYDTYFDYEIVKKLKPSEVEFYSNVKKYNL